ncbi:MAG TPA: serine dehydratase beta chain, partial [Rhizomicrobium sp.]
MATQDVGDELIPISPAEFDPADVPSAVDRRTFLMRSAVISAAAILTGRSVSAAERTAGASAPPPKLPTTLSPDLNVVKEEKLPIVTLVDEFYKVGPGPSSSHTIGPMRITYDFYQ